jgi:hypothetical protein
MADDRWHIEGSFRDGSYRVRDDQGQYKSLSVAILEETSEVDSFNEDELAEMFDVDSEIILEHLGHLRQEGLIDGDAGNWKKKMILILMNRSVTSQRNKSGCVRMMTLCTR